MTQLEEAKKAVEQICLRQNDCWHDTKTIATAVYVMLIHMIDADRKTEPSNSEKPNNCKDLQDWKDRMWAEAIVTEPTISILEQVDKDINVRSKDKPKTQTETQNSNLTFEKADEPRAEKCPFDDAIPCKWVCTEYGNCKYKPKTEPQTDCAWK